MFGELLKSNDLHTRQAIIDLLGTSSARSSSNDAERRQGVGAGLFWCVVQSGKAGDVQKMFGVGDLSGLVWSEVSS